MNFSIDYGIGWLGALFIAGAVMVGLFLFYVFVIAVRGAQHSVLEESDDADHGQYVVLPRGTLEPEKDMVAEEGLEPPTRGL